MAQAAEYKLALRELDTMSPVPAVHYAFPLLRLPTRLSQFHPQPCTATAATAAATASPLSAFRAPDPAKPLVRSGGRGDIAPALPTHPPVVGAVDVGADCVRYVHDVRWLSLSLSSRYMRLRVLLVLNFSSPLTLSRVHTLWL